MLLLLSSGFSLTPPVHGQNGSNLHILSYLHIWSDITVTKENCADVYLIVSADSKGLILALCRMASVWPLFGHYGRNTGGLIVLQCSCGSSSLAMARVWLHGHQERAPRYLKIKTEVMTTHLSRRTCGLPGRLTLLHSWDLLPGNLAFDFWPWTWPWSLYLITGWTIHDPRRRGSLDREQCVVVMALIRGGRCVSLYD